MVNFQFSIFNFQLCILLAACTEVDVIRCTDTTSSTGYVLIHPDQDTHSLPALTYHFYSMDRQTEYLALPCDGRGNFEGTLPAGTYRVIAINLDAEHVSFSGLDSHERALATSRLTSATRSVTVARTILAPGNVYTVTLSDFDIADSDTLRFAPAPRMLTRRVRLRFLLDERLLQQVTGIEGTLCGVYPSVKLFSGEPHHDDMQYISASTISFEADWQEEEWSALVGVFGLCDPVYGEAYTNILDLELSLSGQTKVSSQVDLSGQLSDIIAESGGTIPLTLSLEFEVKPDKTGFNIDIIDWEADGGEEVELH